MKKCSDELKKLNVFFYGYYFFMIKKMGENKWYIGMCVNIYIEWWNIDIKYMICIDIGILGVWNI